MTAAQINFVYASEADVLNVALFGITAKEWRTKNPELSGNIRDYANVSHLVCLSNLESINAIFIQDGLSQAERLKRLNKIAIYQMKILTAEGEALLQDVNHMQILKEKAKKGQLIKK